MILELTHFSEYNQNPNSIGCTSKKPILISDVNPKLGSWDKAKNINYLILWN